MGTRNRRSTGQLARDRRKIADLYLQGVVQADIAKEVSLSQSTVSRDIAALQREWQASALVDFNEAKAQELAKVDRLEREYWQAWERSCEDAETVTQKQKGGPEAPAHIEKATQLKGQAGDPRFLVGIQWCIEKRCKIMGLDAPVRQDITTDGESLNDRRIPDDEHATAIAMLYDALRAGCSASNSERPGAVGATECATVAGATESS